MTDLPRKVLLAMLAILCAAAFAWWLWGDREIGVDMAADDPNGPDATAGAIDRGGGDAQVGDVDGPGPDDRGGARSAPGDTADVTLTIQLRGLHPEAPWSAALHIALTDGEHEQIEREGPPDADGRRSFDLPCWAERAPVFELSMSADDPNYALLAHHHEGPLDLRRAVEVDVQVVAQFEGRVLDQQAQPVESVRVAAFATRDGTPVDEKVGEASTDANGTYHLRAPPAATLLLLAAPMRPAASRVQEVDGRVHDSGDLRDDLLAAAQTVQGRSGRITQVADFVLPAATPVTGTVRWNDGTPILLATVSTLPQPAPTFHLEPQSFLQDIGHGTLAPGACADTDDEGAFTLPGVTGAAVDLAVTSLQEVVLIGQGPRQRVVPPQPASFVLPQPVHLRVRRDDMPVPQARIALAGIGTMNADATGALDLVCLQPVRVRASHERWRSRWIDLLPAAAGTTVVLALDDLLAELTLEFDGALRVRNTAVDWHSDDGREGHQHLLRDDRSGPFRLFLQPGSYHLRIGAGAGERNGVFLLTSERDVTLATARPTALLLPTAFGGTFALTATDANGVHLVGSCRVFDAAGVDCSDRFRAAGDDRRSSEGAIGELLPDRNTFARILPAGDYQLRMEFVGHGTCEQRVTIREREVTEVRVRR